VTSSLYDYTDKSIPHAGIAAIVYGVIALASALLAWLQAALYGRPAPVLAWLVGSIIVGIISGILAFGILRRSRVAVVLMLIVVVVPQLYTWFIVHSVAGTLVSIVVAGFLLRGARRIFQDHAEREIDTQKV
jgi:hypothetical protein